MNAYIVDGQNIRMIQLTGRTCFLLEAMNTVRIRCECFGNQLDGDFALEARIGCAIDLAHAAGAEPADDLIGTDTGPGRNGHGTARS